MFKDIWTILTGLILIEGCHATCSGDTSNVVTMCKNSVKTGTNLRLDTSLASTLELPGGTSTIIGCTCFVETRIGKTLSVWSNYNGAPGDCGTSVKIGENIGQSFGTPCYTAPYSLSVGTHSNVSVDMELKRPRSSYDANYCVSFTLNYCSNTRFQCNNGACIQKDLVCNSIPNCADEEDELNCAGSCNEGDILCDDQRKCIKPSMRCDNQSIDCLDESDEAPKYCDPNYVPGTGGGNGATLMAQMTITCLESEYLPATTTSTTTTTTTTTTPTTTTKTTTPTTTSTTPKATTTTRTTSTTTTPKPKTTTSTTQSPTTTPKKTTTTTTSTSTTSTPIPTTKTSTTSISPTQTTSKTTSTSQPTTKPSSPTSTTSTSTSSTISTTKTSATTQTTRTTQTTTQSTKPTVKSSSTTKVVTTSEKATSEPTTKDQPSSSTQAASTTSTTSKSTAAQTSSTPPPPATTKQQVVTTEADVDDKVLIVAIVSGVAGLILLIICIICWIRTAHWNRRKTPKMKRYTPENGEPPTHAWYPAVQNNAYTVETVLKAEDLKINDVYIADPESAPRFEPIYAYPKKKTKPNEFILSSL